MQSWLVFPLGSHFKFRKVDLSENEVKEIERIPYASAVGSMMYAMLCTIPDRAHAVGLMSRFLANPGIEH